MPPLRRLLVGLPLVGMLLSPTAEVKGDCPVGRLLSLLNAVESGLATEWLQPPDLETMITVWPGLLRDVGPGNNPLRLPPSLTASRQDQPTNLGRSIRSITLNEAIAIAVKSGAIDGRNVREVEAVVLSLSSPPIPKRPVDADGPCCARYTLRVDGHSFTRTDMPVNRLLFEQRLQFLALNVEESYWNLQYGYWNLYAQEQGLRRAYQAWALAKAKYEAGRGTIADISQARGQYEQFRANRLQAMNDALEWDRQMRGVLGMKDDDRTVLAPSDRPTLAPVHLDWASAQSEALAMHPEVIMARETIGILWPVLAAQIHLEHCLDVFGLTHPSETPDLDWRVGFRGSLDLRGARLPFSRAYEALADQERKAISYLAQQYRRVPLDYELIRVQRAAREAFAAQTEIQLDKYRTGTTTPEMLLEAERFWSNAWDAEWLAVRNYNNALAGFDYARGASLRRHRIEIVEEASAAAPSR